MKKLCVSVILLGLLLLPGFAFADSINFAGSTTAKNTGGTTTIKFNSGFVLNLGSGDDDAVLGASVKIATLTVGTMINSTTYELLPALAVDGFVLKQAGAAGIDGIFGTADDGIVFRADLAPGLLTLGNSSATISDKITLGLSDIEIDSTLGSAALSEFIGVGVGGDIVITLQFTGLTLKNIINTPSLSATSTYSGSIAAVPEPGTLFLLGSGLLGAAGVIRRKRHA